MKSFLNEFVESFKDEDTSMMVDGLGSAEFTGHIDTGCYALNVLTSGLVYGGIPNNSATGFVGETTVGKTFFAISVMKYFLENTPGGVFYADTESSVRKSMLEDRGIDVSRVMRTEPETIEEFRTTARKFLDAYSELPDKRRREEPMLMILDSLGAMSSKKELEDISSDDEKKNTTRDMTKAPIIKAMFRVLRLKMAKMQIPMIITNHVYDAMDMYKPKQISGGSGMKYAADTILTLREKQLDRNERYTGKLIVVNTFKSRLSKQNQEVTLKLSFDDGLDRYYGLREISERVGIMKKVSTKYELPGGAKVYGKEIDENPEQVFTKDVLDAINEVTPKFYMYGKQD
mgnify:CR=1 FL=1